MAAACFEGRAFKAVFTGGPSNTLLTAADLDVALDFNSVREHHSSLGTGAMIVISEGTSVVREARNMWNFLPPIPGPMPALQKRHFPAGAPDRSGRHRHRHRR